MVSKYPVSRLRIFGSALTDSFSPATSDIDLLVEFTGDVPNAFDTYFDLKEDLEIHFDRSVDLVVADAIRNPYFRSEVEQQAEVIYAR